MFAIIIDITYHSIINKVIPVLHKKNPQNRQYIDYTLMDVIYVSG